MSAYKKKDEFMYADETFRCKMCEEFLCSPIMLVKDVGDICGSCYELNSKNPAMSDVMNNKTIEIVLSKMKLPCKYKSYGCKLILNYGDKRNHEKECECRIQKCPSINCDWKGCLKMLKKHMFEKHKELVVKCESGSNIFCIEIDVSDMEKSDARNNYKLLIMDQYKFILRLSIDSPYLHYVLYKTFHSDQFASYHLKHYVEVNSVQWSAMKESTLKPLHFLFTSDEVEEIDFNRLQLLSQFQSNKIQLNVTIDVPQSKIIDDGDKTFQCPVCLEVMRPPIYFCYSGHSVCGNCRPKLNYSYCPTCKGNMTNGRNFIVEELVSKKSFNCKYASNGCTEVLLLEKITEHEKNCVLGRNILNKPLGLQSNKFSQIMSRNRY